MARMMRRLVCASGICACNKHHTPPVPWGKKDRRRQRAREKVAFRKEEQ